MDDENEIPCETSRNSQSQDDCPNVAEWMWVMGPTCKDFAGDVESFFCSPCHYRMLEAEKSINHVGWVCSFCDWPMILIDRKLIK